MEHVDPDAGFGGQDITYESGPTESDARSIVALHVFEYNSTLAARVALGHGVERETVAESLEALAYAIRTQDVAESMYPIDDGGTFAEIFP